MDWTPLPPLHLAERVCSLEGRGDPFEAYRQLGAETKDAIVELLPDGWSFEGRRALDFGCGAGRTLRHFLEEARTAQIVGVDIDAESIEWLRDALCPPLHAELAPEAPPLRFEPASFDLIWALSVFTHVTDQSAAWLLELHRLLKPGGMLIATYMGRWNSGVYLKEPWDEDQIGMNVLRADQGWEHGGPVVLMSDWWVREHWGRAFELVAETPQMHGQTWVLLRRREVTLSAWQLEKPADDPRELRALRHNVAQVVSDERALRARTPPPSLAHRLRRRANTLRSRARNRIGAHRAAGR